jgi:hypothetical protein
MIRYWLTLAFLGCVFGAAQMMLLLHWGLSWWQLLIVVVLDIASAAFWNTSRDIKRHPEEFNQ